MRRIATTIGIVYLLLALVTGIGQYLTGALGDAPFPLSVAPAPDPIVVTVWYGSEKRAWFESAAQRFVSANPRIGRRAVQIELRSMGSGEQISRVLGQNWDGVPPTVISPASSLWLDKLERQRNAAGQPKMLAEGELAPRSLALTPLVAVVWADRAAVLWPGGQEQFWQDIHTAVTQPSWQSLAELRGFGAGSPQYESAGRWGAVKFAHTDPLSSNSGSQALVLLASAFADKSSGLTTDDIANPAFQSWLGAIERSVPQFSASTGDFMDDLVRFGPSKVDIAIVYENVALNRLEAARRTWGDLRIYYPPATIVSDSPFAILDVAWTTPDQRAGAALFRDFLLGRAEQEQAMLTYGFRPVDRSLSIATPDARNPFYMYKQYGAQIAVAREVQHPAPEVFDALLELWRAQFKR
jgi:ABC-type sulfate transport system substrate-binding protein